MKRFLLALTALSTLSACVSLLPEPEPPQALYRLGPVEADLGVSLGKSVLVRQPEAPRVLSGVEMVARDRRGAIRLIEGVEWADRAPRLLQLTLLDYIAGGGQGLGVLPETGARADLELTWRVSEMALDGNTAMVRLELTVLDGSSRAPLSQRIVTSEVQAAGDSASRRAEALSEAARNTVRQAAEFLAELSNGA